MAGIYNRETLFQKNIVDGVREVDMGSIDLPSLERSKSFSWTVVQAGEKCRPDLVSFRLYGTPDLWWLVMWLNGISDPWHDLLPQVALKYLPIQKINDALKYSRIRSKR